MVGINLENHFSLSCSDEVDQICRLPLSTIGITYFNYIKISEDGSRYLLANNAPWIEHFYKNALYKTAGAMDIDYLLPQGHYLWLELSRHDPVYAQGRELFNIDNGVSFVIRKAKETTLYIFGTTSDNEKINSFYVRDIDLFKRFIQYFNDKGADLIKKSSENKIYLPDKQIIKNTKINKININEDKRKKFYEQTDMERFFLLDKNEDLYLTKREAECVAYMLDGATAKQIAKILNISFRTVEYHFDQAKKKLKCSNKEELAQFLLESNIHDIILFETKNYHDISK